MFYELNKSPHYSSGHTQGDFHHNQPVTLKRKCLETVYSDTKSGRFTKITTIKNVDKGWEVCIWVTELKILICFKNNFK